MYRPAANDRKQILPLRLVSPTSTKSGFLYWTQWHEQNFWLTFCVCKLKWNWHKNIIFCSFFLSLGVSLTVFTIRWKLRVRGENKKDTGHRKLLSFLKFCTDDCKWEVFGSTQTFVTSSQLKRINQMGVMPSRRSWWTNVKNAALNLWGLNSSSLRSPTPGLNLVCFSYFTDFTQVRVQRK